jgi:hypothetical protein
MRDNILRDLGPARNLEPRQTNKPRDQPWFILSLNGLQIRASGKE